MAGLVRIENPFNLLQGQIGSHAGWLVQKQQAVECAPLAPAPGHDLAVDAAFNQLFNALALGLGIVNDKAQPRNFTQIQPVAQSGA